MLQHVKKILVGMLAGAAVMTVVLFLLVGYSDIINPAVHPMAGSLGMIFPFFIVANLLMLVVLLTVKWRYAWIPLLGFVLAYVPIRTYFPINFSQEPPEGSIKILSYNVCAYGGNYKYEQGLDTVAGYIKRIDADIVCIQEDESHKFDPVGRFQELYPYNDTIHLNAPQNKMINAIGIHSRYPILRKERINYRSNANGSVAFYLHIDSDTVIVINNHLESTHLSHNDRERYKQVLKGETDRETAETDIFMLIKKLNEWTAYRAPEADSVHAYIESHRQYPIIVCGDFNDTPLSYARRTIAQGLTDCFVESGCGLGLSYNQKGFNFRIDHIMCSDHFKPYACKVDNEMDASDHYPIYCWLKKQ